MEKTTSHVRFAGKSNKSMIASLLGGLCSWTIFTISFLFILALVAYKNADPTRLITPFSYTALCMSALVFGFSSAKLRGKQGALIGALSGVILAVTIGTISIIVNQGTSSVPFGMALCLYAAMVALATVGGAAAMKKKSTKKRKKHR